MSFRCYCVFSHVNLPANFHPKLTKLLAKILKFSLFPPQITSSQYKDHGLKRESISNIWPFSFALPGKKETVSAVRKISSFFCRLFYPLQRVKKHDFFSYNQWSLRKQHKTLLNFHLQGLPLPPLISLLPISSSSPENPIFVVRSQFLIWLWSQSGISVRPGGKGERIWG